ncbi:GNAT family N-acetyltransferase [Echinicola sp. 20G]|uniref:GNAT family N-acetyltransferase n=1 Tax=Echinicola sp. 20G TaxID=2781961 RepID=UPI001910174A|nr:GNAT family N-acetyltransferase [Echinicola sp. 20G]
MNAYEIKIRPAKMDDMSKIQKLYVETIQDSCKNDYSESQIAAWISSVVNEERWRMALSSEFFLVAEDEDKVIGFCALENGNYLDFMYVHHDYQRLGLAERLLKALEVEAQRLGASEIITDASKTAKPFFEKKGFQYVKENIKNINGLEITNYKMSKGI